MHILQRSTRRVGVRRLLYPSLLPVLTLLALLCSVTLWTGIASPPPSTGGTLDPTFDSDGIAITNINPNDDGNDLAIQSDGKIVVVGDSGILSSFNGEDFDFTVVRYNTDGSLDTTFGGTGSVTTAIGDGSSIANAVALQPDGKIVVAGENGVRIVIARYNSDGTLDNSFGSGGVVTLAVGDQFNTAGDVKIQPDGKIVIVGQTLNSTNFATSFFFVRFSGDGSLDNTFDSDGIFVVPQTSSAEPIGARAVALQTDGKMVAVGEGFTGATLEIAVVRVNSDGSLDSTFGGGGMVFTDIYGKADSAKDLAIQPDGKIIVAGGTSNSAVVARYNTDGSLDTSFGYNGVIVQSSEIFNRAVGVALQTDGKILTAQAHNLTFAVARYQSNGLPDTTFGSGGTVITPIGDSSVANAVALQPDGKIVVAGTGNVSFSVVTFEQSADIVVVRYNSDGAAVNNPPVVSITGPASGSVFAVNTPVNFTGTFTDDAGDTHTAQWTFDSISQSATVVEPSGSTPGSANTTYTFTSAGVYKVTLTVTDNGNLSGTANTVNGLDALVVIYDPNAGFVTGGGWINSPAGAFAPMPELTGKVTFSFVSKYQNGATVPTGHTGFEFKAGALNFSSTSYEWLVISGARKAQYKGFGTINGSGNFRFMLTAIDGDQPGGGGQDKFRIRIWSDTNGLIYDNQLNAPDSDDPTTVLGGGSIVIHH